MDRTIKFTVKVFIGFKKSKADFKRFVFKSKLPPGSVRF